MKDWIRIIRPINLLILALTMYGVDVCILQPNFNTYGILFTMDELHFFLLVLSTLLICAGGYILNDYFDVSIDKVNKPNAVLIGKGIAPNTAFSVYMVLSFIGLAIGVYLSLYIDYWKLITVYVMAIALLYFYSSAFKKTALIGNVMVALLAAISIMIILVFEPNLYDLARPGDYYIAGLCTSFIVVLAITAFTSTMVREIVKDLEDMDGDAQYGARTMPITWGIGISKVIATLFAMLTAASVGYLFVKVLDPENQLYMVYLFLVMMMQIGIIIFLFRANTKQQYHQLSNMIKISMLIGLLIMPLYLITNF